MQDRTNHRVEGTDRPLEGTDPVRGDVDRRLGAEDTASLVRHEEELRVETRPVVSGGLRVHKRVVTEERVVQVRREELVIEEIPAHELRDTAVDASANPAKAAALEAAREHQGVPGEPGSGRPVIEMVLHEERVVTEVVPVESVRVYVDRVTEQRVVEADLAKEVVTVEQEDTRRR